MQCCVEGEGKFLREIEKKIVDPMTKTTTSRFSRELGEGIFKQMSAESTSDDIKLLMTSLRHSRHNYVKIFNNFIKSLKVFSP